MLWRPVNLRQSFESPAARFFSQLLKTSNPVNDLCDRTPKLLSFTTFEARTAPKSSKAGRRKQRTWRAPEESERSGG
jgi:hypothetical protein